MRNIIPILIIIISLWGCSTTKYLPEGEQLYTGIYQITFNESEFKKQKRKQVESDSVGVITAIDDAVQTVGNLFSGSIADTPPVSVLPEQPLTPEQKAEEKKREKELAEHFSVVEEELNAVLSYAPNGAIFGSSTLRSPLQFRLRIYNSCYDSHGGIRRFLFKRFAAEPILVSTVSPEMRAKIALNTLRNYGYFGGSTRYEVITSKNPKKAKISYHISPGKAYLYDTIRYERFTPELDSLIRSNQSESLLKQGKPFSAQSLVAEQSRLERLFRENGYYYYTGSNITFLADTLMRKHHVQLKVVPKDGLSPLMNKSYNIGNLYMALRRTENEPLDSIRTLRTTTVRYGGKKPAVRFGVLRKSVAHRSGDRYSLTDQENTFEMLAQLNVFSSVDVRYIPRDTLGKGDTLDIYVNALLDKLYDSSFEMNATLKSNDQMGPGLAYSLSKRNAFGGAEKVTWKLFGSYEWQLGGSSDANKSLMNSYEMGTQLAVELPRFVAPFIHRRHLRFPASTTFAINGDWQNRAKFFQRATVGLGVTYKWRKYSNALHELNAFSLDYNKLISTTTEFDEIRNNNPALYVSMRDQFVPSASYTFTYNTAANHRNPIWMQFSIKEAGNLTSAIYAVGGQGFNKKDKELFNNPFAQFLKVTAEFHNHIKINNRMKFAYRFFGGMVYSYGNSSAAPYADQFYVGGANSIRGFTVRALGPGSYRSSNAKYAYMDQTGDIKLEVNAELRARLLGDLHGAFFVDAGNVWLMRKDELRPGAEFSNASFDNVAVGTGLGLRYDLDFLVLRFDVGVPLHAPYDTGKKGWYNIPKFADGIAYNFAIGYPF
jgi:outer membrane protein assembly factor BamA